MTTQERDELAKVIVDLLQNDAQVHNAIINLVYSCPNIMKEY